MSNVLLSGLRCVVAVVDDSLFFCLFSCSLLLLCCLLLPYIAADAALKEEHVIDGRTIDVKRAVPRDRAPQPRLVRVLLG